MKNYITSVILEKQIAFIDSNEKKKSYKILMQANIDKSGKIRFLGENISKSDRKEMKNLKGFEEKDFGMFIDSLKANGFKESEENLQWD